MVDDEANIVVRDTLMKLIHHLQQNPHSILMNWTRVSSQHDRDIAEQMNSESWDRSVHTVKRIPKPWKAQWLIQHDTSEQRPFTRATLDKMDGKQNGVVEKVVGVVLCVND